MKRPIPLFEVCITLFSIYLSIMFFIFAELFEEQNHAFYTHIRQLMPQIGWAIAVFVAAMTKVIGLLLNNVHIRRIGLVMSGMIYTAFSIGFATAFPNISTGLFAILAVMCFMNMTQVRSTEL